MTTIIRSYPNSTAARGGFAVEYNRKLMGHPATKNPPRPPHPYRRRTCLALLALIIAVCFSLLAAAEGCGPPTGVLRAPERPNVILILADDLDARLLEDHPESYPNIQKLAAGGTSFESAFVSDPLCCPSRATILRGQYAHNHRIEGNEIGRASCRERVQISVA